MAPDLIDTLAAQLDTQLDNPSVASWDTLITSLASPPVESVDANKIWFVRQVAECRRSYLAALLEMRGGAYYDAWCRFERIELDLRDLLRNPVYDVDRFAIPQLAQIVERWQSIFPYRLFTSPEIIIKAEDCSICGRPVDPWSDCGHEVGKLYEGRVCHRVVRDMEVLSFSIVEKPVQKIAVLDPDCLNYDYRPIDFVLDRLPKPFFEWRVDRTTASYSISSLGPISDDEPCLCGSGKLYSGCCKGKPSIVLPHLEFWFGDPGDAAHREVEIVVQGGAGADGNGYGPACRE